MTASSMRALPSPRARRGRRRLVLVVAAGAVASLTACLPVQAGAAAVVGDAVFSQQELADQADEITGIAAANDQPPPDDLPLSLVGIWVEETLTEELAAREGVTVSDTEVATFLAQFSEDNRVQIAVTSAIGPSTIERAARTQMLQAKLAQELVPGGSTDEQATALRAAMGEVASDLGVSVNPRYGTFDPALAQVGARDGERLSVPEPVDSAATGGTPVLPQN